MSIDRQSVPRLRSVRYKDGRAPIRVFHAAKADRSVADNFMATAKRCAGTSVGGAAMTGFAIVAWSHDEVFVNYENGPASRVAAGGVPQHVHTILLTEQALRWAQD